jgi:hypothetical protein
MRILASYGSRIVAYQALLDFNTRGLTRDLSKESIQQSTTSKFNDDVRQWLKRGDSEGSTPLASGGEHPPSAFAQGRAVLEPTIIRRGSVFVENVITSLPYRILETKLATKSVPRQLFGGEVWVQYSGVLAVS